MVSAGNMGSMANFALKADELRKKGDGIMKGNWLTNWMSNK